MRCGNHEFGRDVMCSTQRKRQTFLAQQIFKQVLGVVIIKLLVCAVHEIMHRDRLRRHHTQYGDTCVDETYLGAIVRNSLQMA